VERFWGSARGWLVIGRDSERPGFELPGKTEELLIPFFVVAEECIKLAAPYDSSLTDSDRVGCVGYSEAEAEM